MGKYYEIKGVSNDVILNWITYQELSPRVITYVDDYGFGHLTLRLNWFEVIVMRTQMVLFNMKNPCVLKLEKVSA